MSREVCIDSSIFSPNAVRSRRCAGVVISQALRSLADQSDRGRRSGEPDLRELPIRFGRDGYIVRYSVEAGRVIIARIRHGRERNR